MDIIKKTRDDYNKIARHYAQTRPHVWPELLQFKPFIHNGQRILDWGCGHGRLIELFEGYDVEYYGIDQSIEQLKLARAKYRNVPGKVKFHFFCTAKRQKRFLPNFFDLAFMVASFFHLPDEQSRLKTLHQVYSELKSGGRLILTVWNLNSAWAKRKKFGWKKLGSSDFLIPWKNQQGKTIVERYYHNFTPSELEGLLVQSGFTIERLEFMSQAQSSDSKGGRNLIAVVRK